MITETCNLSRRLRFRIPEEPQIIPFSSGSSPQLRLWKVQPGCFNDGMGYVPEDVVHFHGLGEGLHSQFSRVLELDIGS